MALQPQAKIQAGNIGIISFATICAQRLVAHKF